MRAKVIVVLTFLLFSVASGLAGTEKVLYSFTGGLDGGQPYAGVIFDPAGNLYGVTQFGGAYNQGTVFELSPSPSGTWTETVLYSFTGGSDGSQPMYDLAMDGGGNLYGTAAYGGDSYCGTVYELSPSESGWTFTLLHTFGGKDDGCSPQADLNFNGNRLLGTTAGGGCHSMGTAFRLFSDGVEVVYSFGGNNGNLPNGLTGDGFYGTSYFGGKPGEGVVFELGYDFTEPCRSQIEVKHTFASTGKAKATAAGYLPVGDLATQGGSIMYGATQSGGVGGFGTVYQLTNSRSVAWHISVLHSFTGLDGDGAMPWAGVVLDPAGNLYGTTSWGGAEWAGTVFELTPGANNEWTETVLYSFTGRADGNSPISTIVLDGAGNVYGTTYQGGTYNQGVVYEVTPGAATTTTLTSSPNPSTYGQAVTFIAAVTSSAGAPPDGETVSFMEGQTVLGTGSLSGGSASLTISTLPKGTNSITAAYGGDSNFVGSTSNVVKQKVEKERK